MYCKIDLKPIATTDNHRRYLQKFEQEIRDLRHIWAIWDLTHFSACSSMLWATVILERAIERARKQSEALKLWPEGFECGEDYFSDFFSEDLSLF